MWELLSSIFLESCKRGRVKGRPKGGTLLKRTIVKNMFTHFTVIQYMWQIS